MPYYGYKCGCGKEFRSLQTISNRDNALCECGKNAVRDNEVELKLSREQTLGKAFNRDKWAEGWWEHISTEPVYIRDADHLRQVCKQNDCHAPGVLD